MVAVQPLRAGDPAGPRPLSPTAVPPGAESLTLVAPAPPGPARPAVYRRRRLVAGVGAVVLAAGVGIAGWTGMQAWAPPPPPPPASVPTTPVEVP